MTRTPNYQRVLREVRRLLNNYAIIEPPVDPGLIARKEGIAVRSATFNGKSAGVAGFYDPSDNLIVINKDEYPLRKTFTVAHELGHAILHKEWAQSADYKVLWRDPAQNNGDAYEKEANAFAARSACPKNNAS